MTARKQTVYLAIAFLMAVPCGLSAKAIKCFVPSKSWAVTIDLNDFEPSDVLGLKTILGGRTADGLNITILIEKTKQGTTPAEVRKLYGYKYASGVGQKETIQGTGFDGIAVLVYKWATPNLPDANQALQNRAKEQSLDMWGFHGYAVKDDIAFDIHLSADMSQHKKEQMFDIIKSFQVASSSEQEDFLNLTSGLAAASSRENRIILILDFIKQYPANPEAQFLLGDNFMAGTEYEKAENAYLKALDNHKSQPISNPRILLLCYDGLGMSYGIRKKFDLSEKYLKSAYELAGETEDPHEIGLVAYNMACLYAESNKPDEALKYLAEAIERNPDFKEDARKDASFDKIKDNARFRKLLGD